jgi:hypothetical protein
MVAYHGRRCIHSPQSTPGRARGWLLSRRSFARHIHSTSLPQKFTSAGQALQRANMATNCLVDGGGRRWCKSCPFGDNRAQSGHVAAMIHLPSGASDADRKRDDVFNRNLHHCGVHPC